MNTRYLSVVLGLFLIMTTVYVPVKAAGTDTKLYAGGTCVPTADPHVHGGGDGPGTIFNNGEVELPVFCPVVRDVSRGQEIGVEKVTIWVVDESPDDERDLEIAGPHRVHCSFNSRDNPEVSPDAVFIGEAASKGANPNVQKLEMFNLKSASRGYYFIQCGIPAKVGENGISRIIAYEVVERQ